MDKKITKKIKKPTIVRFRKSDGTIAKFKATKTIKKPNKIDFPYVKKNYKRKTKDYKKEYENMKFRLIVTNLYKKFLIHFFKKFFCLKEVIALINFSVIFFVVMVGLLLLKENFNQLDFFETYVFLFIILFCSVYSMNEYYKIKSKYIFAIIFLEIIVVIGNAFDYTITTTLAYFIYAILFTCFFIYDLKKFSEEEWKNNYGKKSKTDIGRRLRRWKW